MSFTPDILVDNEINSSKFIVTAGPKNMSFEFVSNTTIITVTSSNDIEVDLPFGKNIVEHFLTWLNDLKILYNADFGNDENMVISWSKTGAISTMLFKSNSAEINFIYNSGSNNLKITHDHAPLHLSIETFKQTWLAAEKWINRGFSFIY